MNFDLNSIGALIMMGSAALGFLSILAIPLFFIYKAFIKKENKPSSYLKVIGTPIAFFSLAIGMFIFRSFVGTVQTGNIGELDLTRTRTVTIDGTIVEEIETKETFNLRSKSKKTN